MAAATRRGTESDAVSESDTERESARSMWRLYGEYGRPNAFYAIVGVVGTTLARLAGLVPAVVIGLTIDAVFLDQRPFRLPFVPSEWIPEADLSQLWLAVALVVGASVFGAAISWVQNWGWNAFAQRVQHALRVDTYDAMQALDMTFFDEKRTGEVMSILSNDVNQLESFLNDGISSALRITVMVGGIGVIMAGLNPQLALVSLLPLPALAAFTYLFVTTIRPKYAAMRQSVGALNSRLENNLGGIEVIKTEHAESYESERVRESSQGYFDANWDAITTRIKFFPGLEVISGVGFAVTFAVGGYWVLVGAPPFLSGVMSEGDFVTFAILVQQFIWPMAQFGQIINLFQRAEASADRVYGLLSREEREVDGENTDAPPLDVREGRVAFENVTFGYGRESEGAVLEAIDFDAEGGDFVGIVGPTGAGKSTLLKLLPRLYDVRKSGALSSQSESRRDSDDADEGVVTIDGQDVSAVSAASLRRAIGYVSQEPFLFYGTVEENIAYGTFDVTDREIEAAARAAEAHEFITNLPDGYDTVVGERGVKLSGGQRQRVVIARTICKDPAILVLDEATSHVDTETEALIQRGLSRLAAGKTTFAIAHRLSTIKRADQILVLDDGRIAERGTHEELLAREGLYANLWRVQAGEVEDLPTEFVERAIARTARIEAADLEADLGGEN